MSEQESKNDGANQPPESGADDASSEAASQTVKAGVPRWSRIPTLDLPAGTFVGPYKILSLLGEGGFGVVYLAERHEPHDQRVALKIIKPGMDSKAVIARFEQERQALAVMDHPNVARVFDAGATSEGRPYFVMQYVKGEPITEYCDRHNLTIRQRLELFVPVCEAVQHAHHKGIIHRDIKPSNVLVSIVDGRPMPTVIDFGVAKAIAHTLTEKTIFTVQGALIGTPEYMSPEQAEMGALDVDTRTDVYSLGVLLYEVLTGALPFDREFLQSKGFDEIRRIIREVDPPRPSTKLTSRSATQAREAEGEGVFVRDTPPSADIIARRRQMQTDALAKQLRKELEWIPMMAMRKDRAQRYKTAVELADDIRSYLAGRPLIAGPEAVSYRLKKFVRRNRSGVIAAGLVAMALIAGIVGTSLGLMEARHQRDDAIEARKAEAQQKRIAQANEQQEREQADRADREAEQAITQLDKAERIAAFMEDILKGAGPSVALGRDAAMLREMMDAAAARIAAGELKDAPEAELRLRLAIGDTDRQLAAYDEATAMLDAASALAASLAPASGESGDLALALSHRGGLLFDLGRAAEAEPLFQQALEMNQRLFKGDHRDVADGLNNLGVVRGVLGRFAEAEPLYQQALEMRQRLYKGDHPNVAQSLNNLAVVRRKLGRAAEAEPLIQLALEMNQRLFKGDHPDVARDLNNLGFVREALGRAADAEPLIQQGLEMRLRLYKGDHPDVAASLINLAGVRQDLGRAAEAEPLYRQALEMYQRLFKGDHQDVATSLNNLALLLRDKGDYAGAEPLYREALAMYRRLLGDEHPYVATGLNNLAVMLRDKGDYAGAEPLFREALAMRRKLLGDEHPTTLISMSSLVGVLTRNEKFAEAEALGIECHDRCAKRSGPAHKETIDAIKLMISLYDAWHAAEPGKGFDAKAAEWRAKLDALSEQVKPAGESSQQKKTSDDGKTGDKPAQP